MKFKEIKPGMVIHCPKEEDARALLEHLEELGFLINEKDITHPEFEWSWNVPDGVCYTIDSENSWSWGRCEKSTEDDGLIYTEFSDLIEPDDSPVNSDTDSPMSAVELLEWLKHAGTEKIHEVFGYDYAVSPFEGYTAEECLRKIIAYEAAKKAGKAKEMEKPKPVEYGKYLTISGLDNVVLFEEEYWFEEHAKSYQDFKLDMLEDYAREIDGKVRAKDHDICRVVDD